MCNQKDLSIPYLLKSLFKCDLWNEDFISIWNLSLNLQFDNNNCCLSCDSLPNSHSKWAESKFRTWPPSPVYICPHSFFGLRLSTTPVSHTGLCLGVYNKVVPTWERDFSWNVLILTCFSARLSRDLLFIWFTSLLKCHLFGQLFLCHSTKVFLS